MCDVLARVRGICWWCLFFASRRRHTRCALVTGVQTYALPISPTPPSGPRKPVEPIDPNSPGGRAAAEALSQVLAEITVAVWQRRAAQQAREDRKSRL